MTLDEAKKQRFKFGDKIVLKDGSIHEIEHIDYTKMRIYARRYKNSLLAEVNLENIKQITG